MLLRSNTYSGPPSHRHQQALYWGQCRRSRQPTSRCSDFLPREVVYIKAVLVATLPALAPSLPPAWKWESQAGLYSETILILRTIRDSSFLAHGPDFSLQILCHAIYLCCPGCLPCSFLSVHGINKCLTLNSCPEQKPGLDSSITFLYSSCSFYMFLK